MIELIVLIIEIYVFINNIKFFNGIYLYIQFIFIIGLIIYSIVFLNQKNKFILYQILLKIAKFLILFSLIVAILGFYMIYARSDMQGFDKEMNYIALSTGLINFLLSCFSYYVIIFTKSKIKKRIK